MDHTEVLERLEDAFGSRNSLHVIDSDQSLAGSELRQHIAACAECRHEYEALRTTGDLLVLAAPDSLRAPAGARERLMERVAETGRLRGPSTAAATDAKLLAGEAAPTEPPAVGFFGSRSRLGSVAGTRRRPARFGLAAAAAVVLLVAGGAVDRELLRPGDRTGRQAEELVALGTAVDRMVAEPAHRQLVLRTGSGSAGGTVLLDPSSGEMVILSRVLVEPADTRVYRCYLVRGNQEFPVGRMEFAQDLAYWVGPVHAPSDLGAPGDRFIVRLEPGGGAPSLTGQF